MEFSYFCFITEYTCVSRSPLPFTICLVELTCVYLAAVLLKQYIKKHWDEDEEGFENPVVASNEKVLVESKI